MLLVPVFFLLIPHVFSLNFSFTRFQDDNRISYEKTARLFETSIDLVSYSNSVGRATYYESMHLWDKATGKLTDFTTNFTFVIKYSGSDYNFGDGMAFFLAPTDSKLPNNPTVAGGGLALIIGGKETIFNSTDYPFVAVEFDIFPNTDNNTETAGWDPSYVHVGVDINSIKSNTTVEWNADIKGGRTNEALISYNASTHNLSISFTNGFDSSNNTVWQHLHQIVDLRKYLPERVTFGFSAATGASFATHRINKWSFYAEDLPNIPPSPSTRNATALAIGLGIGGFVLVSGVVWFVMWKNKKKMEDDESYENMIDDDFERGTGPKKYSYAELASAANYFKDEHKLGQGGFGSVYRGFLKDSNSDVAIKRISEDSKQGKKEFASEVRIISQLRHRNLVQLLGWCHERK